MAVISSLLFLTPSARGEEGLVGGDTIYVGKPVVVVFIACDKVQQAMTIGETLEELGVEYASMIYQLFRHQTNDIGEPSCGLMKDMITVRGIVYEATVKNPDGSQTLLTVVEIEASDGRTFFSPFNDVKVKESGESV